MRRCISQKPVSYAIYCYTCAVTGKRYIGQTGIPFGMTSETAADRRRKPRGYADSPCFFNAIRKYGWEAFPRSILEVVEGLEEADKSEVHWIAVLNTVRPHGYNIQKGGRSAGPVDLKTRLKISATLRAKFSAMSVEERLVRARWMNSVSPEKRHEAAIKANISRSPESRRAIAMAAALAGLKESTHEQRSARAVAANAARSQEERSEIARTRRMKLSPEMRRDLAANAVAVKLASTTHEQRSEQSRKANAALTAGQVAARSQKLKAAFTDEKRAAQATRMRTINAVRTPEQRAEIGSKAAATRAKWPPERHEAWRAKCSEAAFNRSTRL